MKEETIKTLFYRSDEISHGVTEEYNVLDVEHTRSESLQHGYHSNPTTPKLQHTSNQEQYDQCGNSTE